MHITHKPRLAYLNLGYLSHWLFLLYSPKFTSNIFPQLLIFMSSTPKHFRQTKAASCSEYFLLLSLKLQNILSFFVAPSIENSTLPKQASYSGSYPEVEVYFSPLTVTTLLNTRSSFSTLNYSDQIQYFPHFRANWQTDKKATNCRRKNPDNI